MLRQSKAQINWESVDGLCAKPRRLRLAKGGDGLDHCPATGCEPVEFASQRARGCRKHVKTKHHRNKTHLMNFAIRNQRT